MSKTTPMETSIRERVSLAIEDVGLRIQAPELLEQFIKAVCYLIEQETNNDGKKASQPIWEDYEGAPPMKVVRNLVILRHLMAFSKHEINTCIKAMKEEKSDAMAFASLGEKKQRLIEARGDIHAHARANFPALLAELRKGTPLDEMDLAAALKKEGNTHPTQNDPPPSDHLTEDRKQILPISQVVEIEELMEREEYQNGEADAIFLVAERFLFLGEFATAGHFITQIRENSPDHPGAYALEAKIGLTLHQRADLEAERNRSRITQMPPPKEVEEILIFRAEVAQRDAETFVAQACEAAIKTLLFLPDAEPERATLSQREAWDRLQAYRVVFASFIVDMVGSCLNPHADSPLRTKILACLDRLTKLNLSHTAPPREATTANDLNPPDRPVHKPQVQAVFSKDLDDFLLKRAVGFMIIRQRSDQWPSSEFNALNIIRALGSREDHALFAGIFIERLRDSHPLDGEDGAGERFARLFGEIPAADGPPVRDAWRIALHEHLDAVMSREEQHEMIQTAYQRWEEEIRRRGVAVRASLLYDEIRRKWAGGDLRGAYGRACEGEAQGLYRRDEAHGALTLRRLAQRLLRHPDAPQDLLDKARAHLQDAAMEHIAEALSREILNSDDDRRWPDGDFRWPLNDAPEGGAS